jgi:hypothetical protein
MMRYFRLSPEVAGDWGDNIVVDVSTHPPVVSRLHFEFQVWLGDEIVQTFPCYLATDALARLVEMAGLSGVRFGPVEVSTSPMFEQLYPGRALPVFRWMKVHGQPGIDDFGLRPDASLVVSESALSVLRTGQLERPRITPDRRNLRVATPRRGHRKGK